MRPRSCLLPIEVLSQPPDGRRPMSRQPLITRRQALRGGAVTSLAALGPFFHVGKARADKGEIVVASWGGSRTSAMREVMFKPFVAAQGSRVRDDGPPRTPPC